MARNLGARRLVPFRKNEPFAKPLGKKRFTVHRAFDEPSRRQRIKCTVLRGFLDLAFGDKRDYVHVPVNAKRLFSVTLTPWSLSAMIFAASLSPLSIQR